MHAARLKLGGESDEDLLSGRRMKMVDERAYSGSVMSARLKMLDKKDF